MDVNFDPALRPPLTVPATPVAKIAALAARQVTAPAKPGLGEQQSFGQDAPAAEARARRRAEPGESVARLQDHVQTLHRELHFRVDEATGQTVVRVVDADTGALIRQMPSQDALEKRQIIDDMQANSGLLVREQA
jgi:flagellar protein FlaG